jgi:hypothetical protein
VGVVEGLADLGGDPDRRVLGEPAVHRHPGRQAAALDQLVHQEAGPAVIFKPQRAGDVRVVETGRGRELRGEPPPHRRGYGRVGPQHLDGHRLPGPPVERPVHRPRPAAADQLLEFEAG